MGSDIQIGRVHVYVPGGGDRFRQCVCVCVCECLVYPGISLSVAVSHVDLTGCFTDALLGWLIFVAIYSCWLQMHTRVQTHGECAHR